MTTGLQIAGLVLSALILAIIAWANLIAPWRRRHRMKTPFKAYFRTDNGAKPMELHVRANAGVIVQINREPRLHYTEHEIVLGFEGLPDERPFATAAVNLFMKRGQMKRRAPDTDERHYIDDKDAYHIRETRELTRGNCYSSGFEVQTRVPGRFPLRLLSLTDAGEGRPQQQLVLVVDPD